MGHKQQHQFLLNIDMHFYRNPFREKSLTMNHYQSCVSGRSKDLVLETGASPRRHEGPTQNAWGSSWAGPGFED